MRGGTVRVTRRSSPILKFSLARTLRDGRLWSVAVGATPIGTCSLCHGFCRLLSIVGGFYRKWTTVRVDGGRELHVPAV